ncbi:hypothetical protein ACS0TY_034241 [Phlomoides rotata]
MGSHSTHKGRHSAHKGSHSVVMGGNSDQVGLMGDCAELLEADVIEKNHKAGQHKDFDGNSNIPCYDVCPNVSRRTLLSDSWKDIMKVDVGLQFPGGATDFRAQLIKYTTRMSFKFKYKRNDGKYIHAVCNDSLLNECDWFIKAKRVHVTAYFQVFKANFVHKCVGKLVQDESTYLTSKIIGDLMLQNVRAKPDLGGKEVINK